MSPREPLGAGGDGGEYNRGGQLFTKNTAFSEHVSVSIGSEPCPMIRSKMFWLKLEQ